MGIKTRFCARCGRETDALLEGICADCYWSTHPVKLPRQATILHCPGCGAIKFKGTWIKAQSTRAYLAKRISEHTIIPYKMKLETVRILKLGKEGVARATVRVGDKTFSSSSQINLTILKKFCPECAKERATSWAAKIQIRSQREPGRLLDAALKLAKQNKTRILKVEEQKKGVDLYFTKRSAARGLASGLAGAYGLKTTETFEQAGWDRAKGKLKYRSIVLLREV